MPEQYSHLDLPLYPQSYGRQPRQGRSSYTPRSTSDKAEYLSIQTEQLDDLQQAFEEAYISAGLKNTAADLNST